MTTYSVAFMRAVKFTLEEEGIFSNHSWDPGGKTKYGITEGLARECGYQGAMRNLTVDQAIAIYFQAFWAKMRLELLSDVHPRVALEVFDTAVNTGTQKAGEILQQALNEVFGEELLVDGVIGPATRNAVRRVASRYSEQLVAALNGYQFEHYITLLRKRHRAAPMAIKGWMRRLVTPHV